MAGLDPGQVLSQYEPEQRLAGLEPEQRFAGLSPEEMKQLRAALDKKLNP